MNHQILAIYEKGVLRPLEPLDLPEHTELTVTVAMHQPRERGDSAETAPRHPTRSQPLSLLAPLVGTMPAGGDALKESEALYDPDW
ncbi:MAG: antitoxin family protein [Anaerolineae bacterium]|jgi:predicted DNA-binding antitoxin AbrB/MazE fold protein